MAIVADCTRAGDRVFGGGCGSASSHVGMRGGAVGGVGRRGGDSVAGDAGAFLAVAGDRGDFPVGDVVRGVVGQSRLSSLLLLKTASLASCQVGIAGIFLVGV